jgi:hypothetical protein
MLIYFKTLLYFCQCNSKIAQKIVYEEKVQLLKDKFTIMDCVVEEKWYHCWNIMINQSFSIID